MSCVCSKRLLPYGGQGRCPVKAKIVLLTQHSLSQHDLVLNRLNSGRD